MAVFAAQTEAEAAIVRGVLEAQGIPTTLDGLPTGILGNVFQAGEDRWGDILVPADQADAGASDPPRRAGQRSTERLTAQKKGKTGMRIQVVAASVGTALLFSLAGTGARAQDIHVIRPAHGAIVRETVQVKVASGDLPSEGYVAIYIDGNFRVAQTLPASSDDPVYVWDTKAPGPNGTDAPKDGDHTLKVEIYSSTSKLLGSDTVPVRVANQIAPPSPALKLTYHWPTQHKLTYRRVTAMTVPGDQSGATGDALTDAASGTTRGRSGTAKRRPVLRAHHGERQRRPEPSCATS